MPRLLHDRFLAHDARHGWDLTTGALVVLDDHRGEPVTAPPVPEVAEALDHGVEGRPRWIDIPAAAPHTALAVFTRAGLDARARGYVTVHAAVYLRLRDVLAGELHGRALMLLAPPGTSRQVAARALVDAAALSPRPHLLLTTGGMLAADDGLRAREARAAYGRAAVPPPLPPDVLPLLARARRAATFVRSGRHAAAERLLREVGASLARRGAHAPAARAALELGRLLLGRGRAADAERTFAAAAAAALQAGDERTAAEAHLWQVQARVDAAQLTAAESLCRALLAASPCDASLRPWMLAALARVLLWQGRPGEIPAMPAEDDAAGLERGVVVWVGSIGVRVCLARGDLFGAGLRARALLTLAQAAADDGSSRELRRGISSCTGADPEALDAARRTWNGVDSERRRGTPWGEALGTAGCVAGTPCDPGVLALAHLAHLRVRAATGDLTLASTTLHEIVRLARAGRMPLVAIRAQLIWADALRRARRLREAEQVCARMHRLRTAVPPLLRRAIDERQCGDEGPSSRREACPERGPARDDGTSSAAHAVAAGLVVLAQGEEQDAAAVRQLLERAAGLLRCSRLDLCSADAGPVSTIASVGAGLPTTLGTRVLETGIVIGPDAGEVGVPVRLGARLVGALVARWPVDRTAEDTARPMLSLVAAVLAPRVEGMLVAARDAATVSASIPELVGVSAAMATLRAAVARAAAAPFNVLIEGESGVGKELVARAIHQLSRRRERRFCDVNCAAIPDELLESELFGHTKGAFTGAVAERAGLFEEAHGGTLFLDEVVDLSARAQAKLLRAIQQQEVRRVGESFARPVDVRVVSAANRDLRAEASAGRFRQDLLYRLDVVRIRIPPLRERPEDVPVLVRHFWEAAAQRVGTSAALTHGVLAALARYHWPGNVRELQNVMAGLAVAAPSRGRVPASLVPGVVSGAVAVTAAQLAPARLQFERRFIEAALARAGGSRSRAARELGLSRQGLLKMMARLGVGAAADSSLRRES